jgi:hypothetical protein
MPFLLSVQSTKQYGAHDVFVGEKKLFFLSEYFKISGFIYIVSVFVNKILLCKYTPGLSIAKEKLIIAKLSIYTGKICHYDDYSVCPRVMYRPSGLQDR